jgi:hypothetical protein
LVYFLPFWYVVPRKIWQPWNFKAPRLLPDWGLTFPPRLRLGGDPVKKKKKKVVYVLAQFDRFSKIYPDPML